MDEWKNVKGMGKIIPLLWGLSFDWKPGAYTANSYLLNTAPLNWIPILLVWVYPVIRTRMEFYKSLTVLISLSTIRAGLEQTPCLLLIKYLPLLIRRSDNVNSQIKKDKNVNSQCNPLFQALLPLEHIRCSRSLARKYSDELLQCQCVCLWIN